MKKFLCLSLCAVVLSGCGIETPAEESTEENISGFVFDMEVDHSVVSLNIDDDANMEKLVYYTEKIATVEFTRERESEELNVEIFDYLDGEWKQVYKEDDLLGGNALEKAMGLESFNVEKIEELNVEVVDFNKDGIDEVFVSNGRIFHVLGELENGYGNLNFYGAEQLVVDKYPDVFTDENIKDEGEFYNLSTYISFLGKNYQVMLVEDFIVQTYRVSDINYDHTFRYNVFISADKNEELVWNFQYPREMKLEGEIGLISKDNYEVILEKDSDNEEALYFKNFVMNFDPLESIDG